MQVIVDSVITWLNGSMTRPAAGVIEPDTQLIELGILDSIEILNLVSFLEEHFGVSLPIDEFVPENFQTPAAIAVLVGRLDPIILTDEGQANARPS
jgi:acyl carrier protein